MKNIIKVITATAVFAAVAGGSAVGTAEHIIARSERENLRNERRKMVITESYKTRFGKTKFRNREVTVDGYGREVK